MTELVTDQSTPHRSRGFTHLEVFVTVIALSLPLAGALYREIAFAINGRVPLGVGAAMPLPTLVVVGLQALFPALVLGAWIAWYTRRLAKSERDRRQDDPSLTGQPAKADLGSRLLSRRVVRATFAVVAIVIAVWIAAVVLLGAKGIGTVVMLITAGVLGWFSDRLVPAESDHVPLSRTVAMALAVTALLTTAAALGPTTAGTYTANVRFVAGSGTSDGTYSMLADDGTSTWLMSCKPNSSAVRVQAALVASITALPFGPSPEFLSPETGINMLMPQGFVQRCPS